MSTRRNWYEMLEGLAARNASVKVVPLTAMPAEGDAPQAAAADADGGARADELAPIAEPCTVRLLSVDPDWTLTLELPPVPEQAGPLRRAAAVDVLTVHEGQRCVGRCRVADVVQHRLNDQTLVAALRLAAADDVQSAQRRQFFRADMTGTDAKPVRLVPESGEVRPFRAHLLNLSGGGMKLRVERMNEATEALAAGQRYACRLELPGEREPVDVHATLVHAELTPDRTLELGMAFDFATDGERRRVQDRIVRFTTELERKRLQRRRRSVA